MTTELAERPAAAATPERARAVRWGLVAVLTLPILAGIVAAFTLHSHPAMDWALIELRVRDVGTGRTPLLGPFSRFGWNHPGPLLFWGLAIPYRLLGSGSDGLFVGAGLVNLLSAVGIAWQAHRRGGLTLLAWTALLGVVFLHGQGGLFVVDPWNPTVVVLPFFLLAFLTWSLTEGDHRLAPLWIVVASWIVQSHLGFAPLVVAFGLWALGWLLTRHRNREVGRWLGIAAMVGLVLWLPPLIEQVTGDPGNGEQIARHYLGDRDARDVPDPQWNEPAGFDKATEVYGRHLALDGVWSGGDEATDIFTGELLGSSGWGALPALVAFAAASAWAVHRRWGDAARLAAQTALGLGVGFLAAARIDGYAFPYLFGWLEVVVLFLWLSTGWSVMRSLPRPVARRVRRVVVPTAAVVAGLLSVLTAVEVATDLKPPLEKADRAVAAVAPATIDATRGDRVLLVSAGSCLNDVAYGVALQLERHGIDVVVSADQENRFGEERVWNALSPDHSADVQATVACRDAVDGAVALADDDPDVDVVASWDPVPSELAASEDEIDSALADALRDLGRDDLLPDIESGWIVFSGPGAGLTDEVLGPYRELLQRRGERVVVLVGPAEP